MFSSIFDLGQHNFTNFGSKFFNKDVDASHYLYTVFRADDLLAYTTRNGDVVQLNAKTNETSIIIDNTTLVNIVAGFTYITV